jgi:acyl-CoA thioesterase-1
VIHFNWGLHDIRKDKDEKHQVGIDEYEKNLRQLVARLKKTGAKLIWCSTTPVPEKAAARTPGDEVKFNAVAKKIMEENSVAINDLHAFAASRLKDIQMLANVHFTKDGSEVLGKEVTAQIEKALKK